MTEHLPILQIVLPMMTAPLCILLRRPRATWILAFAVTWFAFGTSVLLLLRVLHEGEISYALGGWPPPWGIELRIDAVNAFVLLIVTGISSIVLTASPRSLEAPNHARARRTRERSDSQPSNHHYNYARDAGLVTRFLAPPGAALGGHRGVHEVQIIQHQAQAT